MSTDESQLASLLAEVAALHEQDRFVEIIEKLEPLISDADAPFKLGIELSRAYINAANAGIGDGDELYAMANAVLDRYDSFGNRDSLWLFYKGYALFKLGLVGDAVLRFDLALKHLKLGSDDELFSKIRRMKSVCESLLQKSEGLALSPEDEALLDKHVRKYFGSTYRILFKTDRYELLYFSPTEEQPVGMICTKGLSAKRLNVPAGADPLTDSRLELCVCLPPEWEFNNAEEYNIWPLNTLCRLADFVFSTDEFVGFGYTFSDGKLLHSSMPFTGGMLTAPGLYDKGAHETVLSDGSYVHFFELIFLHPMEIAFRNTHPAAELVERFFMRKIAPSPVRKRPDVCAAVNAEKL